MTLYTTHCPKCIILKNKLDEKGVEYDIIDDKKIMIQKKMLSSPQLEVDGNVMTFSEAIEWVKQLK